MERVGVRQLRQNASAILRRVRAGDVFEVTDRGRPVAVLVRALSDGLARLDEEGAIRRGQGDLLEIQPVPISSRARPPSELVTEGRDE